MSELSVDKITGKTGTGGSNSPLQFSGDTVTLGTGATINSGATIGSGVSLANATFPAGHVTQFVVVNDNSTSGASASNGANSVATSNFCTVTVPNNSYVYMESAGGKIYMNSGSTILRGRCRLFYTIDGSTPDASDSIINGAICGGSFNVGGTFHVSGFAGGTVQNTSGGTLTYKVTWGIYGDGAPSYWNSHADYPVIIKGIVYN